MDRKSPALLSVAKAGAPILQSRTAAARQGALCRAGGFSATHFFPTGAALDFHPFFVVCYNSAFFCHFHSKIKRGVKVCGVSLTITK